MPDTEQPDSDAEPVVLAGIPTGYDLLQVLDFNPKRLRSPSATPLMMEFAVNPQTGPFLVSSSRKVLWIATETVLRTGKVRAAVRPIEAGEFYREVVSAIRDMGGEAEWGNVHPRTPEGMATAIAHLQSYDLNENEVLAHPSTSWDAFPNTGSFVGGLPLIAADWVPEGMAVVLPRDRAFVGFMVFVSAAKGVAVVHNASRGVAVLT